MEAPGLTREYCAQVDPQAYEMSLIHRLEVARLMARLKPDWWDASEALQELTDHAGWYLANSEGRAAGWLTAACHMNQRTVEIESLGFDLAGTYCVGSELTPLVHACEEWGLYNGMANCRYIMSSRGFSIHNQEIIDPASALLTLRNYDRQDFDWFTGMGYTPCGILPQIYGYCFHGIVLVKELQWFVNCTQ